MTALNQFLLLIMMAVQAVGFYLGMLSFFWVITTPFAGAIFGCYLYVCSNWWHVHYDESFSALRIQVRLPTAYPLHVRAPSECGQTTPSHAVR